MVKVVEYISVMEQERFISVIFARALLENESISILSACYCVNALGLLPIIIMSDA